MSSSASASPNGKKVISIQPHLFKLKGKTAKRGARAPIDTSKIKEQLVGNILKRRKEKLKQEMEMEKKKEASEFDKSFNFMLQEKEQAREGKETQLRKTIKQHQHTSTAAAGSAGSSASPPPPPLMVNVEWPNEHGELTKVEWSDKEVEKKINDPTNHVPIGNSMLNYVIDKEINYGCLKGGLKKTFKNLSASHHHGPSPAHPHNKTVSAGRVQFNPAMMQGPTIVIHPVAPTPAPSATPSTGGSNSHASSANIPPNPTPAPPVPIVVQTPIVLPPPPPVMLSSPADVNAVLPPTNFATSLSTSIPTNNTSTPLPTATASSSSPVKSVSISDALLLEEPAYVPKEVVLDTPTHAVPKELTEQSIQEVSGGIRRKKTKASRPSVKEIVKRKTLKYSYKLGKNKTFHNRIAVLSTSKPRMKLIQDAKQELQKTPIEKMRTYLMDRNLLASGSSSPHEVIRQMYTEANLAADITNHNNETLLENYLDNQHHH